ncbi:uncharacterized protein B0H64DRAFT_452003 [Chaetomium fimeti]|uniref:Polynucleotide 5'-hydroxyl-kinase GRC3 n=1 Tax=Chaetomium fimeti TaxID=1854472 RepID=A0AAE0LMJ0_9PEZI|nr:hypothetical protein B0H64DRAFT_452003 [Chaetomium fimeti]
MATNKRRKLDGGSGSESGGSTPTVSAFAARQQLWGAALARKNVSDEKKKAAPEPVLEDSRSTQSRKKSETPSARSVVGCRTKRQSPEAPVVVNVKQTQGIEVGTGVSGPSTPGPESNGILVKHHSTFKPNKKNLQRKPGGRVVLSASEGERLVVLGSFGIKIREGEATFAGAILTPSDAVQWVHAPHCHAVAVLRTADDTVLELQPHPAAKGLRQLAALNPAFAKLWNESPQATASKSKSSTTFQIIYTSQDVPKRAVLQELVSPAQWNKKLSGLAAAKRKGTPVIFLCGPKSSGKSTFGRLLTNRLITDRAGSKNRPWSGVMVLDIDPGQPEYSPPGIISLSNITIPNLSPSFCHPTLTPEEGQLRAHAIASVTPGLDPAHYIECVLDLLTHYQRGPDPKPPLVVNTPGWVQGTGLDILTELIMAIRPTEVIYMSQDGPEETVNSLQAACTATAPSTPFSTLPSQPSEASSARTSLHFRTMQTMSYFHLHPPTQQPYPTWDPTPLSELRPWRVRYAGKDRGFLGILCYDHQPAPELLAEAINGTVMALVRLENRAALGDLLPDTDTDADAGAHPNSFPPSNQTTTTTTPSINEPSKQPPQESKPNTPAQNKEEEEPQNQKEHRLPLLPNPQSRPLPPQHSHLLGLVLVRGVDTVRGELQLLAPRAAIDGVIGLLGAGSSSSGGGGGLAGGETAAAGMGLVLVAGRFDAPTWAYGEDLYLRGGGKGGGAGEDRGLGVQEEDGSDDESASEEESEGESESGGGDDVGGEQEAGGRKSRRVVGEVPWVEMLHGSQSRAVGSKVWRVRRDLGRN